MGFYSKQGNYQNAIFLHQRFFQPKAFFLYTLHSTRNRILPDYKHFYTRGFSSPKLFSSKLYALLETGNYQISKISTLEVFPAQSYFPVNSTFYAKQKNYQIANISTLEVLPAQSSFPLNSMFYSKQEMTRLQTISHSEGFS